MEPSPQQRETRGRAEASEKVGPGTLNRFKELAARLFTVDRERFKKALEEDEKERRAKRER